MKARFLATAASELKEAMEFYEAVREGLGAEFLAEIEVTVSLIEAHPLAWTALSPPYSSLSNLAFSIWSFLSNQV